MSNNKEIVNHRNQSGIVRGKEIEITVNAKTMRAYEGETIGTVLTAAGIRSIRRAPRLHGSRGLYCCMGSCYGCLVTVDGQPNIRACITRAQAGQNITLQEGLGQLDPATPEPSPGRLVRQEFPIVVIGGGPAGLSAAIAAARVGSHVLVIDENLQAGGQIYRQLPESFHALNPSALGDDYTVGQKLLEQAEDLAQYITIWSDALVWSVFESRQLAIARHNELILLDAKSIVVATGAYERPMPVPGWTLPGVMTAGGAQILLKSQRIRPGRQVLLAGTGPLQLVVANQMLDAGMDVVALAESAPIINAWRFLPDLIRQPALIKQGLHYMYRLKRAGVQMLRSYVLKNIDGEENVASATLGKVDSGYRPVAGSERQFEVDTVCIGYGLIPSTWLTSLLGCKHVYNQMLGGWVPFFDTHMQTDRAGIFVAGDGAGIAGVIAAKSEGTVAGLYAAAHAGNISEAQAAHESKKQHRRLFAIAKFRQAMDRMYQIPSSLYANVTDDTIVCRCEEVTAGAIRQAIRKGTMNLNDIKKRTRCGMGYCQGTNCQATVAAILVQEFGAKADEIKFMTTRPPARPIPLSLLVVNTDKHIRGSTKLMKH